ncbi:MAG: PD-(D/E)XK nuclease family protein, partial [bacterium]|nr:PD-(D/E)XK nuclease family protein [bacterium]
PSGELIVVDYKATSKDGEVSLDAEWQDGYKRQLEVYQWLFRRNGFAVSATGYFVYCNGNADREAFDGRLEFSIKVIPYEGNDDWVEPALGNARRCLTSDTLPEPGPDCEFCQYRSAVEGVLSESDAVRLPL